MGNYCFSGITFDLIYKIVSLLVVIGTFIILILGYRKFLQNQLRNKQLDTVHELIKHIQQSDWHYLHFNNFDNAPSNSHIATLFDIAAMEEFDECEKLLFWGKDIEPSDEELLSWDFFFKFHSHPFLPTSIAVHLKKFNLWKQQNSIICEKVKNDKYIAIGRKKIIPEQAYFFFFSEGEMKDCSGFKKIARELRDSITEWTKKYGLKDLNITTSHIYQAENK